MPEISIILKVDDRSEHLQEAVDSILTQSFTDFEFLILMEDRKHDKCPINTNFVDSRLKTLFVTSFDDSETFRLVIEEIKGEYIIIFDAEHLMLPGKLGTQLSFMETHRNVDVCGTWINKEKGSRAMHTFPVRHSEIALEMLFSKAIYTQSVMMRVSVFKEFLENVLVKKQRDWFAHDYEVWIELIINGCHLANIPEVLLKVQESKTISSINQDTQNTNYLYILSHYLEYYMDKIVEIDPNYFDFLNNAIELQNSNRLSLFSIRESVRDIYNLIKEREEEESKRDKIKILFCIDTLCGGGAEKLLIDILKKFDYDKYAVDLLVLYERGIYFTDIPEEVSWFFQGSGKIKRQCYDVEIAFLEGDATRYVAARNSSATKIAWVHIDLYDFHWTKRFYENDKEEQGVYQRMDKIIFVSENVKNQFLKLFGSINSELFVVYNLIVQQKLLSGLDCINITKRKFTLCSIGRLTQVKGYQTLIEVAKRLVEAGFDFDLWIIGEGEQRTELEELIRKYSLNDVVFLQGFHKNPMPFLKAADVFVSSSLAEGYPLVICEALCVGLPVVATTNAGSEELLDKGKYGLLIEQDEEQLYRALKSVIENNGLRRELRNKALERARLFDQSETMNQIYAILG